ncbi:MAG: hypothetical protein ABI823_02480 [Bryobacteraceae bacterium]
MRANSSATHFLYVRWLFLLLAMLQWPAPARPADLEILSRELPWAIVDKPYAPIQIEVLDSGRCPVGGLGFAMISGTLPQGVRLSHAGYLTGTPAKVGSYWFAVRAANGCSKATRFLEFRVTGAPVLHVSPDRVRFVIEDGVLRPQTVRVTASWPKLAYQVTVRSGSEWLKAVPHRGVTPASGGSMDADILELSVDPKGLKAGFYRGEVSISAWEAVDAPTVKVELVVGTNGRETTNQR